MHYRDGGTYKGEWRNNEWNGTGCYTKNDGTRYVGQFKIMRSLAGDRWLAPGVVAEVEGAQADPGVLHSQVGDPHSSAAGSSLPGFKILQYLHGDTFNGQVKSHHGTVKPHGIGTMRYADGATFSGTFQDGERTGNGQLLLVLSGGIERALEGAYEHDHIVYGEGRANLGPGVYIGNFSMGRPDGCDINRHTRARVCE